MMKFEREIICFDLETTGLSMKDHKIVQFACVILDTDLNIIQEYNTYINPGNIIWSPEAIKTHGITPEKVQNEPFMRVLAKDIFELFQGRDILTHNGNKFDIPFLANELDMCGYDLNVDDIQVFDTFVIESKINSRKLGDLYSKYTGNSMEDAGLAAHDALSDVCATASIFKCQDSIFKIDSIENKTVIERDIGYENGIPVMMYGKYKGVPVVDVIKKDPDYLAWLLKERGSKRLFNTIKRIYESMK